MAGTLRAAIFRPLLRWWRRQLHHWARRSGLRAGLRRFHRTRALDLARLFSCRHGHRHGTHRLTLPTLFDVAVPIPIPSAPGLIARPLRLLRRLHLLRLLRLLQLLQLHRQLRLGRLLLLHLGRLRQLPDRLTPRFGDDSRRRRQAARRLLLLLQL